HYIIFAVELKPTLFPTVPRLLTRVCSKLQQATISAPGIKGALSRRAVAVKLERLENGLGNTHPLWDRILFNKVKQALGGRVRKIVTGSAPIASEVLQFMRIAFCCDIAEGYGQTEGVASATISFEGENKAGHVGGPMTCCEIKLVDVPEMNYFATDKPFPRGELCYRGTNAFLGYYKDEAKTKETIDEE
ncbi:14102_t:CDS:2, partial [Acaulospora colombiana]